MQVLEAFGDFGQMSDVFWFMFYEAHNIFCLENNYKGPRITAEMNVWRYHDVVIPVPEHPGEMSLESIHKMFMFCLETISLRLLQFFKYSYVFHHKVHARTFYHSSPKIMSDHEYLLRITQELGIKPWIIFLLLLGV